MEGRLFFLFEILVWLCGLTEVSPKQIVPASTSKYEHNIRVRRSLNQNVWETGNLTEASINDEPGDGAGNGDGDGDGEGDGDGVPYNEEEAALHQKASLIIGVIFVPSLLAIYLCCRYVPDKILVYFTGE